MIGHVFASSGAVCLALAPSTERPDEYVVLARVENGYAIATVLSEMLGRQGGPDYWLRGDYFTRGDQATNLKAAVEAFAREIGRDDIGTLRGHVEHAEQVVDHRAHLAGQS